MPKRYPHCYNFPSPSGTSRWYVRRKVNGRQGPKIRVHGDYGSQEFEDNYYAIMSGGNGSHKAKKISSKGTLSWLIDMWRQSSDWQSQAPGTKKQREYFLAKVLEEAGGWDYLDIRKADIRAGVERRKDTPAAANNFLKAMRALFRWAKENDLIEIDPTEGVKWLKVKTDGFAAWTMEDVEQFKKKWPTGTRERLALEVLLNTGLRRSDAVRLGRQHVKNGVATIQAEKTGVTLYIPITDDLARAIAAGPTGDLAFIATESGRQFTKESFGNWFRKVSSAAGVNKNSHGLRKLAATTLANTSGSEHELQALFGWQSNRQSMVYTRQADKRQLALRAAEKLKSGLKQK